MNSPLLGGEDKVVEFTNEETEVLLKGEELSSSPFFEGIKGQFFQLEIGDYLGMIPGNLRASLEL